MRLLASRSSDRFYRDVVRHGDFSVDWFTHVIPAWEPFLIGLRPRRVLELGSYEGMSACFMLWLLPETRVTCIDEFVGYWPYEQPIGEHFDHNTALVDANRVEKLVGPTHERLVELGEGDERFDLVYVDASHQALDVLADAALAWRLVEPGGVMLFDDYGLPRDDPLDAPTVAIDAFSRVVATEAAAFRVGGQFALRRHAV